MLPRLRVLSSPLRLLSGGPPLPPRSISGGRAAAAAATATSSATMDRVRVRRVDGEDTMTVAFPWGDEGDKGGRRQRQLQRSQAEALSGALARIAGGDKKDKKAAQALAKKRKGKKIDETTGEEGQQQGQQQQLEARLLYQGNPVDPATPNVAAWRDGAVLEIGGRRFAVDVNVPAVTSLSLSAAIMAGFPVFPRIEVEFGNARAAELRWSLEDAGEGEKDGGEAAVAEEGGLEVVCRDAVFTPHAGHVGKRLRLRCVPKDGERCGDPVEVTSPNLVGAGPGPCLCDARHAYTRLRAGRGRLRAVSYNVLADVYAQTEVARTALFPYCPAYALGLDYRQNLLRKELAAYNADVVCLQEVDKNVFAEGLRPVMEALGMEGMYRMKERQKEGLATFFRSDRFRLVSRHDVTLAVALQGDPAHGELRQALQKNPRLFRVLTRLATELQVSVLQSLEDERRRLIVANTHLYWHPKGSHVRLIQGAVALRHLELLVSSLALPAPAAPPPLLFCGDFNSFPSSGLVQLLTTGHVGASHPDWSASTVPAEDDDVDGAEETEAGAASSNESDGGDDGGICGRAPVALDLRHELALYSASGEPEFTNFVAGFRGCIDYVLASRAALATEAVVPLPGLDEVQTHTALPSVAHPSDHLALVCDLRFCD
ncbi:2',5'-phosphodiesterase 12 [Lampetra planeri]